MLNSKFLLLFVAIALCNIAYSQEEVNVLNYSQNNLGQVLLEIDGDANKYYLLETKHDENFESITSMTLGIDGTMYISEPLDAYEQENYTVWSFDVSDAADTDLDGEDDITEFMDVENKAPLNAAQEVPFEDGMLLIPTSEVFTSLATINDDIPWAPFLNDQEFVKFVVIDQGTDSSQTYFLNSGTHSLHSSFLTTIGMESSDPNVERGQLIYHPTVISNNGTLGVFSMSFSQGFGRPFETVQSTYETVAANMPFLKNNLSYYVTPNAELEYLEDQDLFDSSRIPIITEEDVFADIDYLGINIAEGYGRLRVMNLEEVPGARDIVIYESIPNNLPRVGGIITSFVQTPLSHVNLRAIQDNVPNAFIRDPLTIESIANLIDNYVHFQVQQGQYIITEATLEEVNNWHDANRPDMEQIPELNLSYTSILPLDDIDFDMSDGFGAKCANLATMREFDFPDGTIPDGFGVPFYFYQEFMEYNGFFDHIQSIMELDDFQNDFNFRMIMLDVFRQNIKDGIMPQWMLDELQTMHDAFPENSSVRCRSSTNNEDLPGFVGAGLYKSKTQHPDEGHISKSIKQVFASMWNFRAYEEREYYRVNHFAASMGVVCHLAFKDEKANGVGVSFDPIYQTDDTYYLNSQLGEDLVTNPGAQSIPEEILLDKYPLTDDDYIIIRRSNLVPEDQLIIGEEYLDLIREYLTTIHDEFAIRYEAENNDSFAMDIEYKINSEDKLVIKQARPWATFWSETDDDTDSIDFNHTQVVIYPNPATDRFNVLCACEVESISIVNLFGQKVLEFSSDFSDLSTPVEIHSLSSGIYILNGQNANGEIHFSKKFMKH